METETCPRMQARKTLKILASTAIDGAKKYFSDDPLALKKYFSNYHMEAFAAAYKYALELVGQCDIASVEDLKAFAEMVTG